MVGTKCVEYDVAVLYLQNYGFDLSVATEAYKEDEKWEQEHPMEGSIVIRKGQGRGKGKAMETSKSQSWKRSRIGAGMTGQLS